MDLLEFADNSDWEDVVDPDSLFNIIPKIGEDSVKILKFEFEISLRHAAAIKYLYWKCFEITAIFEGSIRDFEELSLEVIKNDFAARLPEDSNSYVKIREMYRTFVESAVNWMQYIDKYVFNRRSYERSYSIGLFPSVVLNERGNIDYFRTAKNLMMRLELNEVQKLKIACIHCLEEEIHIFAGEFLFPSSLPNTHAKTAELVTFWKRYKNDEIIDFERFVSIVWPRNFRALMFFLNKLEKSRKLVNFMNVIHAADANVQCMLLNLMTRDEQLAVMKRSGGNIVSNLLNDFVWSPYVLQVLFFGRNAITNKHYFDLFGNVATRVNSFEWDDKYLTIFHSLWNYAPKRVKNYFFKKGNTEMLCWVWYLFDHDFLIKVMSEATLDFRRKYIYSGDGGSICIQMFKDDYPEEFTRLTMITIPNQLEREQYVFDFLLNKANGIFGDKLQNGEIKYLTKFLRKNLSPENLVKFKKTFLYKDEDHFFFRAFLELTVFTEVHGGSVREKANFTSINEVLLWFLNDENNVLSYKKEKLRFSSAFGSVISKLLLLKKFELIDELKSWCRGCDTESIEDLKKNLIEC